MNTRSQQIQLMRVNRRSFLLAASSFTASVLFSACSQTAKSIQQASDSNLVKVGTSWVVGEDVLKFVRDNLAAKAGITVEIVMMNDWVLPNTSLRDGSIDANFFQHKVFMNKAAQELKIDLVGLDPVMLWKYGIYSSKIASLDAVPQNATVTIANDEINRGQSLRMLESNDLLKIKDGIGDFPTDKDIIANPKNLQINEVEGVQVVRAINDSDLIVSELQTLYLSGNKPNLLGKERVMGGEFALVLTVLKGRENEPKIQKLNKLLHDPELADFIKQKYEGRLEPAF